MSANQPAMAAAHADASERAPTAAGTITIRTARERGDPTLY